MNNQKSEKTLWQKIVPKLIAAFGMAAGVIAFGFIGYFSAYTVDHALGQNAGGMQKALMLALAIVAIYVVAMVQTVIHEAGHLVFGLATGYRFASFRIGSFMWIEEAGKIRFKRMSIAGTGGQCLMTPPGTIDDMFPVTLYNFGGAIFNLIAAGLSLILYFLCAEMPIVAGLFMISVLFGVMLALLNGIPLKLSAINNDGHNALSLKKDSAARRGFWIQLKVNEQMVKGVRPSEMPDEWFVLPSEQEMGNSMSATIAVLSCNRLLDAHEFEQADAQMNALLQMDSAIVGLHRSMLICDRIYCELIGANRHDILENMLTKTQKKFMKSMKTYPSILRTQYAYALFCEKDIEKAQEIKEKFESVARKYPYPRDIESERELMEIAQTKQAQ